MRVTADRVQCISSGHCVLSCPEVFGHDENSLVVLRLTEVPAELEEAVMDAVDGCPTGAIADS